MNSFMEKRISRTQLDTTKSYYHKRATDGKITQTFVGKFVRAYTTDNGMTVHMEFDNFGLRVVIDEDMWVSIGKEISYFTEI
jgi:hypothetical protein